MTSNLVKTAAYNLPTKELALGKGVNKVLAAAEPPELMNYQNDVSRMEKDVVRINVMGVGVRRKDTFTLPAISYEHLYELFDDAPIRTYSAKNGFFGYRSETGRFLTLEELINHPLAYGEGYFHLNHLIKDKPEAVITIVSGGKISRIQADQIMEGKRYYYPLLTSEQILAGCKPADSRGEMLPVGFLRTGENKQDYQVIFVIGQRNWNDITENLFVNFVDGGASVTVEYLPESRKAHNILYVGPLGGVIGKDVCGYAGKGSEVVELHAKEGSLIRFNIDNNDFLNNAKMYYKFSVDEEECQDPCPEDGYVYNTRIPLYFGGGTDYPSGVILPSAKEHKSVQIKIMAFGAECPETEIDSFKLFIDN